jgi:hypothetical protein
MELNLPSNKLSFVVFGYDITASPRTLQYALAGGSLNIMLWLGHDSLREILTTTVSMTFLHYSFISILLWADALRKSYNGGHDEVRPPDNKEHSFKFTRLRMIAYIIALIVGLGAIGLWLITAASQLYYVFGPYIMMYVVIVRDAREWKEWDKSTPCPHMWKDWLEDELWWF